MGNGRRLVIVLALVASSSLALAAPKARCPDIPGRYTVQAAKDVAAGKAQGWTRGRAVGLRKRGLDAPPGQLAKALGVRARDLAALCRTGDLALCGEALLPSADRAPVAAVNPGCTEQTVRLSGRLMAYVLDPLPGEEPVSEDGLAWAFIADGEEYAVIPDKWSPSGLFAMREATVTAQRLGNDLYLVPGMSNVMTLIGSSPPDPADLADYPQPAWATDLGLVPIQAITKGSPKALQVMLAQPGEPYPFTFQQTRAMVSDKIERFYRDESWGQLTPQATLFPDVMTSTAAVGCSPWTAFSAVLPQLDATQDFTGFTDGELYAQFTDCNWCGIHNLFQTHTLTTNEGGITPFATGQVRTDCIANRVTALHEYGHSFWIHGGRAQPTDGKTYGLLEAARVMHGAVYTYQNPLNLMGDTHQGGEQGPVMKAAANWLDASGRFLANPAAGTYQLRPVSSPDGTVGLYWKRGPLLGAQLQFRQPGSEWEQWQLAQKGAHWNECIYLATTGSSTALDENIQVRSATDDGCIHVGETVDDPATGFRFRLDGITVNNTDPNKSVAAVTVLSAVQRTDEHIPTAPPPSGFDSRASLPPGIYHLETTATDADGDLIGGLWILGNQTTGRTTSLATVLFPAQVASAPVAYDLDTTGLTGDTGYTVAFYAADAARVSNAAQWKQFFTVTTTTSTSTTSTTVPTKPGVVLAGPTTAMAGVESVYDVCATTVPNGFAGVIWTASGTVNYFCTETELEGGGRCLGQLARRCRADADCASGDTCGPNPCLWADVDGRRIPCRGRVTWRAPGTYTLTATVLDHAALAGSASLLVTAVAGPVSTTSTMPTTSTSTTTSSSTSTSLAPTTTTSSTTTSTTLPRLDLVGPSQLSAGQVGRFLLLRNGVLDSGLLCAWADLPHGSLPPPPPDPSTPTEACRWDTTLSEPGRAVYGWRQFGGAWLAPTPDHLEVTVTPAQTTSTVSVSTTSTTSSTATTSSSSTTTTSSTMPGSLRTCIERCLEVSP